MGLKYIFYGLKIYPTFYRLKLRLFLEIHDISLLYKVKDKGVKKVINKELQLINDEILSYKQFIYEIEKKLSFIKFLDSVDDSFKDELMIDNKELVDKRNFLNKNLRKLLDKKTKMLEADKTYEQPVKAYKNDLSVSFTNNYLSILCNFNNESYKPENNLKNLR